MESFVYSLAMVLSVAAADPSATSSGDDKASEADDRTICRVIRKTGTRFDTRICKPLSAWRAIEEKSVTAVRDIQARPQINCTAPSGSAC